MKSKNIIYTIAIIALLFVFYSCKKEVYSGDSGLLISSTKNFQRSNNMLTTGNDYSMMKLILNYGTVTPYKKILANWYITEQNTSILNKEGC
jgi:hypothetical protein